MNPGNFSQTQLTQEIKPLISIPSIFKYMTLSTFLSLRCATLKNTIY
uniref:Uncharacterized protein n=1 Tax=Arundo donax TaxID=35708 RepID=A0A0A9BRL7_ARUDO